MCEQTPVVYKNGDIVWVKLGSCWWPGEVQDLDDLPADWLTDFKKPPLAAIKFFDEDNYEYVKSIDKIYSYNCSRKNEFIKKGLDLHKAKNSFMKKFPDDVVTAEKKTNGDPNIISDPMFTTEKKPNYASILFGSTPKAKKTPRKSTGSSKKSLSSSMESPSSSPKITTKSITHPRFLGRDDHEVRILVQSPTRVENSFQADSNYNCSTCGFVTSRIDVIVLHNKSHIQGVYSTPISSTRKSKKASPKRGKKILKMAKSKTSSIMEDLALIEKGLFLSTESSDEENVEDWDEDSLPPRKRRKVKRKPKKAPVKPGTASPSKIDIRNNLLAEWEEDSEIEVDDVNVSTLSATTEDSEASINKVDESILSTDTNNESTSNLTAKESSKSCFDFEEEDTEIVSTSVGRKIPRVLPPSKSSLSDVENEDSGLSDVISCPAELIQEKGKEEEMKDEKKNVEQENVVPGQFKDPDIEAFKDILNVTNVPSLPEVPHSLKFEQNFHDAKTVKFPDKSLTDEELNAPNDLSQKQISEKSVDELDVQDFQPKKKCIDSLEMEVDDVVRPSVEELTETLSKQDVEVEIAPIPVVKEISEMNSQNKDPSRSDLKLEVKDKLAVVNKFGSDDSNEVSVPSLNKSPVKESTALPSKLINPKKRFVKSFEDFEQQLNNEQRKLLEYEASSVEELNTSSVQLKSTDDTDKIASPEKPIVVDVEIKDLEIKGSGVEFSKLKTQLKSKLESLDNFQLSQSEVLKTKRERTSEKRKHRDYEHKVKSKQAKFLDAMLYDDHSTGEDSLQELIVGVDAPPPLEAQEKEDIKISEASEMDDIKFEYSENSFEDKNATENINLELDMQSTTTIENSNILETSEPSILLQTNQVDNEDNSDLLTTSQPSTKLESDELTTEDCELPTNESTGAVVIDEKISNSDFDIKNDADDLSALSALAAVSELSTSLTVKNEESEDKSKITNQDVDLIETEESKLTEGNMTYFTESDLVDSQVEIVNLSPVKEKCKPVTLSNFSVDFMETEEKDSSEKAPPAIIDETSKTDNSKLRESDRAMKENILDFKSEFQSSDSSASEDNISNASPIYKQNSATTTPDYGNSKLLEILSEGKEQEFRQKLASERSHSKVEHNMSSLFNKEFSKTVPRSDSKNTKFFVKSGTTEKVTPSNKSGKPIILSNKIIKSTPDIETISVQKISSKKTNQGFDDNIDAFIIKKPIKRTIVQEDDSVANVPIIKKQPAYRGKAKILQQTIIKPTGDIVASSVKTSSIDDNMFDINSMPIVLGDQILTEDCIENMPVVLSESVQPSTTKINTTSLITKTHGTQMKLLNKPICSPSSSKVFLKTYASQKVVKSPRIYQPNPTKPIKPGATIISRPSKPDKFIIVPPSANSNTPTPSKYTVGKKTIIKKAQPVAPVQTSSMARIASTASEPTGNKIMIVTNQQGQQSRVLLTPAQQKLLGYQTTGTKLVKNTLKGNILQKTTLKSSVNPKVSSVLSHAIINSMGSVVSSPNQNLILSDGQKLVPIRPHQTKISKAEISKPLKKIQMPSQKVLVQEGYNTSKGQPKTIVIQNKLDKLGQVIKKMQGTKDTLLEQQVAENLQAIKASGSFSSGKSKPEAIGASKSRTPLVKRPSYIKRVSSTETPTKSNLHKMQVVPTTNIAKQRVETSLPPLTPISPKKVDTFPQPTPKLEEIKIESTSDTLCKQEQIQQKPPNQLIIQDALGNQTTITEGQILALPSGETIDGQPQSYMLVTLDESGNLAPLNNEALLSLDPNLSLGGDLSNMVLQIDDGSVSAKKDIIKTEEELLTKDTSQETSVFDSKDIKIEPASDNSETLAPATKELSDLDNIVSQNLKVENPEESVLSTYEPTAETSQASLDGVQTVTCNIGSDPNQQLIITGDPVSTQKFIESLTEGNQDLANLLASAEGNILIHTDEQQILINTDANNQILLPMNADSLNVSESHGNPMFATQSNKNQDILAAALADTDVFQSEPVSQTKIVQSQLSPGGGLYPSGVANVLGTTLSLSSPIMTPLEVPSCNNKKIPDEESSLLITEVPKNVDLPITITDPNISQTAQQRVASLIANELTNNLDLPLNITETGVPLTSSEMNSPSFVYSLPSLDDSVDIHQKAFSEPISMPLLTEEHHDAVHEELSSSNTNLELNSPNTDESNLLLSVSTSEKEENVQSTSQSFLTLETEGLCTLGGAMCSSLSEPPPDMFDLSLVTNSSYVTESEIKEQASESTSTTTTTTITCNVSDNLTTLSSQQQSPKSSIEISTNDQANELDTYDSESRNELTPLSSLPLNSESNSPVVNLDENSCEIPVQPQIVADLNLPTFENNETTDDATYFSSNKRLSTESKFENEQKKAKLD